ncbi:hypothetical protein BURPS1710b_2200 [Burkholderia pseudomallei 1710b]|uniref:Uncharacterized protein n=1 Tax=Burkholderia pseudomallei (strain 1710b) TaxID=320372 RepID=Q3JS57_BURP1|nr:hypothetical protein BURPS1710b_2200 [Burkholderia pseudomallei 1710b]
MAFPVMGGMVTLVMWSVLLCPESADAGRFRLVGAGSLLSMVTLTPDDNAPVLPAGSI